MFVRALVIVARSNNDIYHWLLKALEGERRTPMQVPLTFQSPASIKLDCFSSKCLCKHEFELICFLEGVLYVSFVEWKYDYYLLYLKAATPKLKHKFWGYVLKLQLSE